MYRLSESFHSPNGLGSDQNFKRYGLASHNCWWFAAVTVNALECLASDWTIKPSRDWGKKAIQALGKSTQEASQQVAARFAHRWLVEEGTTLRPVARPSRTAQETVSEPNAAMDQLTSSLEFRRCSQFKDRRQ